MANQHSLLEIFHCGKSCVVTFYLNEIVYFRRYMVVVLSILVNKQCSKIFANVFFHTVSLLSNWFPEGILFYTNQL